jgi:hypothetical protein
VRPLAGPRFAGVGHWPPADTAPLRRRGHRRHARALLPPLFFLWVTASVINFCVVINYYVDC